MDYDFGELGRRHAAGKPHELAPWHVHVDQHPCDFVRRHAHRFRHDLRIDVITGDERVDHIEVAGADAVHRVDAARA